MNMGVIPGRSNDAVWPVQAVSAAAGIDNIITAPSAGMSHYVTGFIGSTASQTFNLIRKSYPLFAAGGTLTLGDGADVEPAGEDFLISFWYISSASAKSDASFLAKSSGDDSYVFGTDASGYPFFTATSTGDSTVTGAINVCDGRWHHIAVSGDRDVKLGLTIFVDGTDGITNVSPDDFEDVGSLAGGNDDLVYTAPTGGGAIKNLAFYISGTAITTAVATAEVALLWNGGIGKQLEGTETYLAYANNLDYSTATTSCPVYGSGDITEGGTFTWTAGGPPINNDDIPTLYGYVTSNLFVFPHAIKIGAGMPLQLHTSDAVNLTLFGYTDSA